MNRLPTKPPMTSEEYRRSRETQSSWFAPHHATFHWAKYAVDSNPAETGGGWSDEIFQHNEWLLANCASKFERSSEWSVVFFAEYDDALLYHLRFA
jgi:hypothetical protein